jgi:hypothetical protein
MQQLSAEDFLNITSSQPNEARSSSCPQVNNSYATITKDELMRRKHFCIFLLMLTNHLDKTDLRMRRKVKALVRACTRKHREGDQLFANVTEVLNILLRDLVGEKTWQHCLARTNGFLSSSAKPGQS